jgi:hypothetical protein
MVLVPPPKRGFIVCFILSGEDAIGRTSSTVEEKREKRKIRGWEENNKSEEG